MGRTVVGVVSLVSGTSIVARFPQGLLQLWLFTHCTWVQLPVDRGQAL